MMKRSPKKFRPPLGTHYLAEIWSRRRALAKLRVPDLERKISHLITRFGLTELGRFYFRFKGGGITGIISLRESHIAFHTWPEHDYLTLDIYTCNYMKDNTRRTSELFEAITKFFAPAKVRTRQILR